MSTSGFFDLDPSGRYLPRPEARSPWSADMLHGRLLAAIAARTVDAHHADDGFRPARLTIDLFRSPAMEAVEATHQRVRDGGRVRVVEVDLHVGGHHAARATVVLLRTGAHPEGDVWTRPDWDVPSPDDVDHPAVNVSTPLSLQIRAIDGRGMGAPAQRQVWLRDERGLLDDEPMGPFVRAAAAADFASPLANSDGGGLAFINADITLYLGRLPAGEWVGLEVGAHVGADGVAVSRCDLFDEAGMFGTADVCAVANAPMRRAGSS
ncbi:thioesterase family protein [Actinomarinicola tropica]|uniref:Thioesterase family protein n=1 Tax=Actinomarinicola tropica TaxID=2789776 RepID=A0A5Q2RI18_9ACTN|nr:acyl-CoA thioesterase domain-containing protein [Actinomarinicola tropica]QGG93647.1 thioesterase family protein [Actinomarinicola tropica]